MWKICQLLSHIDSLFIKRNFIWIQSSLQSSKIRQYSQNCYQLVTTAGTSPQTKQTNWEDSATKNRNSMFTVKACDVKMWLNHCPFWSYYFQKSRMNHRIKFEQTRFWEDNFRIYCPTLPILAMLLTTIRKLVGSKLVMATDDERAVLLEEFRK